MLINCPECERQVSDMAPSCPNCGYVLKSSMISEAERKPAPLSTESRMLVEQRIANDGPSTGVTYLLWFFLGLIGIHRFYLGRTGSAVTRLILTLTIIGMIVTWVWWFVDAFLTPEMIREKRDQLRNQLLLQAAAAA